MIHIISSRPIGGPRRWSLVIARLPPPDAVLAAMVSSCSKVPNVTPRLRRGNAKRLIVLLLCLLWRQARPAALASVVVAHLA